MVEVFNAFSMETEVHMGDCGLDIRAKLLLLVDSVVNSDLAGLINVY